MAWGALAGFQGVRLLLSRLYLIVLSPPDRVSAPKCFILLPSLATAVAIPSAPVLASLDSSCS